MNTFFEPKQQKKAFAEKIGISQGHLQHILSGIKNPSVKLAKKLKNLLKERYPRRRFYSPKNTKKKSRCELDIYC
jgi:transcriptional regulator with XRE-family HTH domain